MPFLFLAALAAQAAPVADPTRDQDVRCLAVMAYATGTAKEAARPSLVAGTMYFIGRIDARMPTLDYCAVLVRLLTDTALVKSLAADGPRCSAILERRGTELQALGKAIRGAASQP